MSAHKLVTSHLNFHFYCNHWLPTNVIYFHPYRWAQLSRKQVHRRRSQKQRQGKQCKNEEVDFAWHAIIGGVLSKNRGYGLIRSSTTALKCMVPLIQLWPS